MSLKSCVVSFADSAGSYQKKLLRLEQSLKGNFDGDFIGFSSYKDIGCEPHSVIPYKFKPYSIQRAIDLGYELILYCDSPIYAKQSIRPVFDYIEKNGYLFFNNIGHSLGDWSKDKTLEYFNIDRNDSFKIKSIMACTMGFNFTNPLTVEVFNKYKEMANEFYPGDWTNDDLTESKDRRVKGSRHDQEIMSALIYKYGLDILKGQDTFFSYESHREVMPIADSVCLFSG